MVLSVADRSSNKNEQIVHAAEVIGRSKLRAALFRAIYRGKARVKSVAYLAGVIGLSRKRVLDTGKRLADNELVIQTKVDGLTSYEKIPFIQTYRDRILRYATNRYARDSVPTKRNRAPAIAGKSVRLHLDIKLPRNKVGAALTTVDDIESFAKVRRIAAELAPVKMPEARFKNGVAKILKEKGTFNDWGGELRDLSSTRVVLKGARRAAAFAFKGPGTTGRLTPGKLGANGDQIQRLSKCPAEVFLIQYWSEIDDSVLDQLEKLIQLKAFLERRRLWYGVIDGQDSARLIAAYPAEFKG